MSTTIPTAPYPEISSLVCDERVPFGLKLVNVDHVEAPLYRLVKLDQPIAFGQGHNAFLKSHVFGYGVARAQDSANGYLFDMFDGWIKAFPLGQYDDASGEDVHAIQDCIIQSYERQLDFLCWSIGFDYDHALACLSGTIPPPRAKPKLAGIPPPTHPPRPPSPSLASDAITLPPYRRHRRREDSPELPHKEPKPSDIRAAAGRGVFLHPPYHGQRSIRPLPHRIPPVRIPTPEPSPYPSSLPFTTHETSDMMCHATSDPETLVGAASASETSVESSKGAATSQGSLSENCGSSDSGHDGQPSAVFSDFLLKAFLEQTSSRSPSPEYHWLERFPAQKPLRLLSPLPPSSPPRYSSSSSASGSAYVGVGAVVEGASHLSTSDENHHAAYAKRLQSVDAESNCSYGSFLSSNLDKHKPATNPPFNLFPYRRTATSAISTLTK